MASGNAGRKGGHMKDGYRHREKMDIQIEGSYPQSWDWKLSLLCTQLWSELERPCWVLLEGTKKGCPVLFGDEALV